MTIQFPVSADGIQISDGTPPRRAATIDASQTKDGSLSAPGIEADMPDATALGVVGDGQTDNSALLATLCGQLVERGKRRLYFPPGQYYAPTLAGSGPIGQVLFLGEGTLLGAYRKRIVPLPAAAYQPGSDIVPSRHLKQLTAAAASGAARICWVGDSTTTAASGIGTDYMVPIFQRCIQAQYPGVAFNWFPYGLGGAAWTTLNGIYQGPLQPRWYPGMPRERTVPWLDLVRAADPDVLFFNFGMNDAAGFDPRSLQACVAKIKAWPKTPDLIFICGFPPTFSSTSSAFGSMSKPAGQEGRDYVAGYTRSYCLRNGYGFIDLNRMVTAHRDGYDSRNCALIQRVTPNTAARLPYTLPGDACTDYQLKIVFPGMTAEQIFAGGATLHFQVGARPDNVLILGLDANGELTIQVNATSGVVSVPLTATGFQPSGSGPNFEVVVADSYLQVFASGGQFVWAGFYEKFGGLYAPKVTHPGGAANRAIAILLGNGSLPQLTLPTITDFEIFGPESGFAGLDGTVWPQGGNGGNHMSTMGVHRMMQPVIEAARWA